MIPEWKELRLDAAWDINGEAASAAHRREVQVGVRSSRGRKPGGAETEVLIGFELEPRLGMFPSCQRMRALSFRVFLSLFFFLFFFLSLFFFLFFFFFSLLFFSLFSLLISTEQLLG